MRTRGPVAFVSPTLRLSWSSCADSMAGCLRKSRESYLGYAVHALKGSSFFLERNGEIWIAVGLVVPSGSAFELVALQQSRAESPVPNSRAGCPQWTGQGTFADTVAGCPAVVSGSRSFCRHGGWLPCSSLGLQGLL